MSSNGATMENTTPSRPKRKVVVIGMDGGTLDLVKPWAEAGHLPNLGKLMSEGAWGTLKSTEPPHSAPAWSTFSTGLLPGKHGVYYFVAPSRDKNRFRPISAEVVRGRRVWQLVSDQGGKVGVINVPMSYPPVPVNGYMIGDFFSPDDRSAFSDPAMYEEVVRNVGGYIVEATVQPNRHVFLKGMLDCIDQRAKVGAYLMDNYPSDYFAFVFTLLDRAQHNFWADMDPDHPLHQRIKRGDMIPDAIQQIHKHIDDGIGKILERVDSDTTVIVMSDHGFRGEYRRMAVNKWLQDIGLLKTRNQRARLMGQIGKTVKEIGLQEQFLWLLQKIVGSKRYESVYYKSVIWPETKVIYGPGQGFYLNVKGRDDEGVVTESEYEPLRDRIIEAMKAFRDPDTGLPVIGDALRREDLYEGDATEWSPDIVPTKAEYFTNGKRWGYGLTKWLGSPDLFVSYRGLSGTHSPDGMFIAWGPNIKRGHLDDMHIKDIAPTTLYAMGLQVPSAMDGRPMTQIFNEAFTLSNPVQYADIDLKVDAKSGQVLSAEHEAVVEQRLKDLGYL